MPSRKFLTYQLLGPGSALTATVSRCLEAEIPLHDSKSGINRILGEDIIKPSMSALLHTVLEKVDKDVEAVSLSKITVGSIVDVTGEILKTNMLKS